LAPLIALLSTFALSSVARVTIAPRGLDAGLCGRIALAAVSSWCSSLP
jgi:hypothetical protein